MTKSQPKRVIDRTPSSLEDKEAWEAYLRRWCVMDEASGCWNWQRGVTSEKYPYGMVTWNKKAFRASRLVFMVFHGQLDPKMSVCHRCDNPRCVNPEHLFADTHSGNMQDCTRKGRLALPKVAGVIPSRLTVDDVIQIRAKHSSGESTGRDLAGQFGVSETAIYDIVNGRTWTHVPSPDVSQLTAAERSALFAQKVSRLAGRVPGLKHLRQEADDLVAMLTKCESGPYVPPSEPEVLKSNDANEFLAHLRRISAEVRTWPMWKRSALGWVVFYDDEEAAKG